MACIRVHTFICGCPCIPLRHDESPASRNETRYVKKRLGACGACMHLAEDARLKFSSAGRAGSRNACRHCQLSLETLSNWSDTVVVGCCALSTLLSVRWVAPTCSTLLVTRYPCFPLDHYLIFLKRRLRSQNPRPSSHKTIFSILSLYLLFLQ